MHEVQRRGGPGVPALLHCWWPSVKVIVHWHSAGGAGDRGWTDQDQPLSPSPPAQAQDQAQPLSPSPPAQARGDKQTDKWRVRVPGLVIVAVIISYVSPHEGVVTVSVPGCY